MNTSKTYKIKGMHCASCAGIIEKTFKKTEGVESAVANYGTESVKVSFDESKINPEDLSKKIEKLGYTLVIEDQSLPVRTKIGMDGHNMSAKDMGMSPDEHSAHLGLNQTKKEKLGHLLKFSE